MSYELKYFPAFLINLYTWYAKKYCSQNKIIRAYKNKTRIISKHLTKEFQPIYNKYKNIEYIPSGEIPKIIWIMWWQGEDNMPNVPKACIKSIKHWAKGYDVRIINSSNYNKYIELNDIIQYQNQYYFGNQRLTMQYLSDIIRSRLLSKYGGVWMDATMLVSNEHLFSQLKDHSFFTIKLNENLLDNPLKNSSFYTPGRGWFCDSFWASIPHNPFFEFLNECMTYHLKKHKTIWDYFIIEYVILIGQAQIPFFAKLLENVPDSNPDLYWLAIHADKKFDDDTWRKICIKTSISKLNWKLVIDDEKTNDSYLNHIINPLLENNSWSL